MTGSLFPPTAEEIAERIDGEIRDLIIGHSGGPLGLRLDEPAKSVLGMLRGHNGAARAVPLREIATALKTRDRAVKAIVRDLRMSYHLPIGSSKSGTGGYYLMVTEEDVRQWANDVLSQVRAEVAVLRAAAGSKAALELAGQIRNDLLAEVQS